MTFNNSLAMLKRLHLILAVTVIPIGSFCLFYLTNNLSDSLSLAGGITVLFLIAPFIVIAICLFCMYMLYLAIMLIGFVFICIYNMFAWYLDKKRISYEKWME